MRAISVIALAALAAALAAAPSTAHHGWGSYDANKAFKIEGPIRAVKYENPHGELELDYQGKRWTATLAPVFRMQNRGLPRESLAVGKTVIVEGYPSRVHDAEMRVERITVDGKTVELR